MTSNYTQDPGYPPQQGGYPPQQGGYPPQQGGYPPQQGGYPPQQGGYPPQQGGYPPQQAGYPPQNQGQGYPSGQGQPGQGSIPMYKGDIPTEDVRDDPNMKPPTEASAPPPEPPKSMPGYSNVGYEEAFLPPPAYEDAMKEAPPRDAIQGAAAMTIEQAKGALEDYVASNCCYGKGPLEEMTLTDLQSTSAFHYILESFCEGRSTKWKSDPYCGEPVMVTGPPPGPWDIPINVPTMFKDSETKMEVPNTAYVKPCHKCYGSGYTRCFRCHGRGKLRCNPCNGTGTTTNAEGEESRCPHCQGDGRKRCYTCHGYGQCECKTCKGRGNLRWYIQLTVKWKNHDDDKVVERTSLPEELIKGVTGQTAFKETAVRVWPVNHFPDHEINEASNNLVAQHSTKFPTERMLMQQHTVRIVPVTNVSYTHKDRVGSFYVYGQENKVYFPDYPASCCCGCSIL